MPSGHGAVWAGDYTGIFSTPFIYFVEAAGRTWSKLVDGASVFNFPLGRRTPLGPTPPTHSLLLALFHGLFVVFWVFATRPFWDYTKGQGGKPGSFREGLSAVRLQEGGMAGRPAQQLSRTCRGW